MGMVAFVLCSLLATFRSGWNNIPVWAWIMPLLVIVQLILQIQHTQQEGWTQKLMLRLPLLAIPAALALWRKTGVNLVFITCMALVQCWLAGASVLNYATHFRFLNQMVLESKPLPLYSQVYHIEFSIMLAAFTLLGVFELLSRGFNMRRNVWLQLLFVATLLNLIFLHVLSVRTGMLAFWAGAASGFIMMYRRLEKRHLFRLLWVFAGLLTVAALTPSIRNRVVNTLDDLKTVKTGGDVNDKSFGRRWEAWKTGLNVIRKHPVAGVGLTGVETAMQSEFVSSGSTLHMTNRIMPHNQWLDFALQSGIAAGVLYLLFFLLAAIWAFRQGNSRFAALLAAVMLAGMFESLLERQAGVITMLLVITLSAMYQETEKNERIFHKSN